MNIHKFYFKKFPKDSRSSFSYWYYHWKAFNLVAWNLGVWKPRYLLHDIEKPWLRLFWDYPKVQKWHREHNRHHIQYKGSSPIDWVGMVIDNECSRFTKIDAPMTAREWYNHCIINGKNAYEMQCHYLPVLNMLGL